MLPQIELFCIGFAAVVDTVLLLIVLERINRPLTAIWLKWALAGATLWHVGAFLHTLLRETVGATAMAVDAMCMTTMATGMLLLNCSILHAGLRIHHTGGESRPRRDLRYIFVYTPVLLIIPIAIGIIQSGTRDFIESTRPFHLPFLVWLSAANLTAAWLFIKNRGRLEQVARGASSFLVKFSVGLITVTGLVGVYILVAQKTRFEPPFRLLTNLSPLAPTLVFAWYLVRRRLLPMVFERTLVYGAILLSIFYLHRLTISPMMSSFSKEFHFDFVVLETLVVVALVLAYQPLRSRFREGLRYFVGLDVVKVRDAARQLSVELSRRADDEIESLSEWFTERILLTFNLRFAKLCFIEMKRSAGHGESTEIHEASSIVKVANEQTRDIIRERLAANEVLSLCGKLDDCPDRWIECSGPHESDVCGWMREADLTAVFRVHYRDVNGYLMLGSLRTGELLSNEQLSTISLLVDQFAATIQNRILEQARQSAERRAVQQEKLSTLGLMAGSLAHELKNPLSSIRTIATLMKEDLDEESGMHRDIDLIVSEIDRLTATTQRLLDFSKPSDSQHVGVKPDVVIERLLSILGHLARQHGVTLTTDLQLRLARIESTDAGFSEIMFNLIKNAIEAVRGMSDGEVTITTSLGSIELDSTAAAPDPSSSPFASIVVADNGPGIDHEVQEHLFEPFVTGKTDGTGLGLYLVGQRVKELSGKISHTSDSTGSVFKVQLPLATDEKPLAIPQADLT